jgi:two-component system chemotaxis sensor kinase CheA
MDDIIQEFLAESYENLDQLDQDLVALESDPESHALLSSIFRTVHTIKGTSGFLGLDTLERVSHSGESLLAELRDGKRRMDRPTTDVLLLLTDVLREMLSAIEAGKSDSTVDPTQLLDSIEALEQLQDDEMPNPEKVPVLSPNASASVPELVSPPTSAAPEDNPLPEPAEGTVATAKEPGVAPTAPEEQVSAVKDLPVEAPKTIAETTVRVDVSLLDALMRQVGELVLVRNQIDRMVSEFENVELQRATQQLNLISGELQEGVMKTRMQPIDHLWSRMPRVVRDLGTSLGREVNLVMEGRETELDRSLLEAVKDPLTHLVRNAVDHGIEPPDVREAKGKPRQGTVTLRAYHAGGQVVVEVSDDGFGIDPQAVGRAAVAKGLRTAAQVQSLSLSDVRDLLFEPGFSTSTTVTSVSGRGVGMDVVRANIENIGGSVDLESVFGEGTTWRLRIPLTLAIMPTLTVECGSNVFAIAQINLLELVAIENGDGACGIEYVGSAPVYRLRGTLLPLVSLANVLGLEPNGESVIAVMQVDQQRFGLMVDRVLNNEEIVVKPLGQRVKQVGLYSGATVLGDGTVALILDIQAIARRALPNDTVALAEAQHIAQQVMDEAMKSTGQLLVVSIADGRRVGIPLGAVTRLERMEADRVERVASHEVVQYRGELIPMVRLENALSAYGDDAADDLLIIILTVAGTTIAVSVARVLDIVDYIPEESSDISGSGLNGSVVVGGAVTELVDLPSLFTTAYPERAFDPQVFNSLVESSLNTPSDIGA